MRQPAAAVRADHDHVGIPPDRLALQRAGDVFADALGFDQRGLLGHAFLGQPGLDVGEQRGPRLDERFAQLDRIVIADVEEDGRAVDDIDGADGAAGRFGQPHGLVQCQLAGAAAVHRHQNLLVHREPRRRVVVGDAPALTGAKVFCDIRNPPALRQIRRPRPTGATTMPALPPAHPCRTGTRPHPRPN